MITIPEELRNQIEEYLIGVPDIDNEELRKQIARYSGFPKRLINRITWSKQPLAFFISYLVDFLLEWGNIDEDDERDSLTEYLSATREMVGGQAQKQLLLILQRLDIERGIGSQVNDVRSKPVIFPSLQSPAKPTSNVSIEEKLIGEPTLMPIAFLETAIQLARAVTFIELSDSLGTGFMISNSLLLTCNHVVPTPFSAEVAAFRFNYQYSNVSGVGPTKDYSKKNDGIFYTNPDLDFTVIELDGEPGLEWGQIKLTEKFKSFIKVDERVNIIQHPNGRPKQISFRNNFVDYIDDKIIQYVTHTEPGSSGSPVFNDSWELVALHHAGGNLREPSTQRRYYRNEGMIMKVIYSALPSSICELI